MSGEGDDYRTMQAPKPVVTRLDIAGPLEWGFYAVGVLLGALGLSAAMGEMPWIAAAFSLLLCASFMVVGRYGAARAHVEVQPHSGVLTLVTGGFLSASTRRELSVEHVEGIDLEPIVSANVPKGQLVMPLLRIAGGHRVHIFGRPIGVSVAAGERLKAKLEQALIDARPELERIRVRVGAEHDPSSDEPADGAATGKRAHHQ